MFGHDVKSRVIILIAAAILCFTFSTCDTPMGLGEPIDWEAPVLTIDPVANPLYVRTGTKLSGTVSDNTGVGSVIMRDSVSGDTLYTAKVTGNRWEINLSFDESRNGEKIAAEIVAYDRARNSADSSMATVTLIIDIRPPIIDDVLITRTPTKTAFLETYAALKALEESDPKGEISENVDKYQNGWFYINGKVSEEETGIEIVSLNIYDAENPDTLFLSLESEDSSLYSPRWLVKEEDIIEAGEEVFPGYKTEYENNQRKYFRVAIIAIDKSKNENEISLPETFITEDTGFFCMWKQNDEPKGIFDPSIGTVVTRGTPLPVEFFDDDQFDKAYSALFTLDQWEGEKPVADGVSIIGSSDTEKFERLKEQLLDGETIYNWRFDKYQGDSQGRETSEPLVELIGGASVSDKLIYVPTGSSELDYGDFVLVSFAGDKKLEPHIAGSESTTPNVWSGKVWNIQVIDDNAPLIVFDTVVTTEPGYDAGEHSGSIVKEPISEARTGDSPEENTFPKLTGGQYFELNGYTLRENSSGLNTVKSLRMAWIPYGMPGGNPDDYIQQVQTALSADNYPNSFGGLQGVQHWEFNEKHDANGTGDIQLVTGTDEMINGSPFKKQVFRKRFDVLGGTDDTKGEYKNFTYNGKLENETKLFVLCVIDNTNRAVYKQMRLLGMKNPPSLAIYDITNKDVTLPSGLPDIYESNPAGDFTDQYANELKAYNEQDNVYSALKNVSMQGGSLTLTENDATLPFQTYTRGTELKYWVMAERSGDLAIADIKMEDITNQSGAVPMGSEFNETDRAVSFVELFPDVTSRVFRFTATDTLGNTAEIQRTVAITNAALLNDITTIEQNGSYGIGKKIVLQANFTSHVRIDTGTGGRKPELNVRYQVKENGNNVYRIASIPCNEIAGQEVLALTFDFTVGEGFTGRLETMYEDPALTGTYVGTVGSNIPSNRDYDKSRPIRLLDGARIMDVSRNEPAFVPGYTEGSAVSMPWTTAGKSLQSRKASILLDGQSPSITALSISGKAADADGAYYFKAGETINFTFTADEPIRAEGAPRLTYTIGSIEYPNGFVYQRPQGSNGMVFALTISEIGGYGELTNVDLSTANGGIVDEVGNGVDASSVNMDRAGGKKVFIKTSVPAAPGTTVGNSDANFYNYNPVLYIADPAPNAEPWSVIKQYSLNGGTTWITFPNEQSENPAWTTTDDNGDLQILNGEWDLRTRYVDKAGNQGNEFSKTVSVDKDFPRLESVSAGEPAGTYIAGGNLSFTLNFAEEVGSGDVSILIKDRSGTTGTDNEQRITRTVTAETQTVELNWTVPVGKEMTNGLYIAEIDLTGLKDQFGNFGEKSTAASYSPNTITMPSGSIPNIPTGIIVDAILPTISTRTPAIGAVSGDNKTIRLTFSEDVMVGSGIITVRPAAGYAIPPVFEDSAYWLGENGTKYYVPTTGATYMPSFKEIYDKVGNAQKTALAGGENFSSLPLNARTGQSAGPYKKMTQGLVAGNGYSGDEQQDISGGNEYMVPDTATKWVLDYQYGINQNIAAVNNIRAALTQAKFRWQEIDAGSAVINGNVVTISLNEPLLKGLDWEVYYPQGAFTDEAGNPAAAQGNLAANTTNYTFESSGVQAPVIRVNRRSFDGKNQNGPGQNRTYFTHQNTDGWEANTIAITDDNGWGINNFNYVHYRVESESPGATVNANVYKGTANNQGAVTAAWEDDVIDANSGNTNLTNSAWDATGGTVGTWVMPNLVRRATGATIARTTRIQVSGGTNSITTATITTAVDIPAGTSIYTNSVNTPNRNQRPYPTYSNNTVAATASASVSIEVTAGTRSTTTTTITTTSNIPAGSVITITFDTPNRTNNTQASDTTTNTAGPTNATGYTVDAKNGTETRTFKGTLRLFKSYNKDFETSDTPTNTNVSLNNGQGVIEFDALEASKSYVIGTATRNGTTATGYEGVFRTVIALNYNNPGDEYNFMLVEGSNIKNGMPSIAGFPVRDAEETGDNRFVKAFYRDGDERYWVSTEVMAEWYFLYWNTGGHLYANGEVNNYLMVGYGDLTYAYNLTR
jgi:hypothetical protein